MIIDDEFDGASIGMMHTLVKIKRTVAKVTMDQYNDVTIGMHLFRHEARVESDQV
jgi:hypothetical protein